MPESTASSCNPAGWAGRRRRRTGASFALTNTLLTGQTLHIDGGEPLSW